MSQARPTSQAKESTRPRSPVTYVLALVALLVLATVLLLPRTDDVAGAGEPAPSDKPQIERLVLRVHARHPHDARAFTQGLVWAHGRVFESTGLRGRSSLREAELETGTVRRLIANEREVFAEGLALVGNHLFQLTWQEQRAYVWNLADFSLLRELSYQGEGWGLCHDGRSLVMSDGTDVLTFRDPKDFTVQRSVKVTREGKPQTQLNELECVDGKVFANVWQSDEILRIEPTSGRVDGVVDASGLLASTDRLRTDVLNGIAYMPETRHFLLTGKLWPAIFEVSFDAP